MIVEFEGITPRIGRDVFLAPNATVIGDVEIGDGASIWFGAVLRGDFGTIVVGPGCSIQDNAVVHVFGEASTILDENVTVGHGCSLEGCQIGAGTVVGTNSVILPRTRIGEQVMIAAGSVVPEGAEIPPRVLVAGAPATVKKELAGSALEWIRRAPGDYQALQARYRAQGIGLVPEAFAGS
ncbi:MAG: gamma carbonic anhydrase family protein [Candidatus Promineifilaceae bacterium]|nr:gamma carbonic anhydrase family protein [Candidatus Promineifilaceae bacterium]